MVFHMCFFKFPSKGLGTSSTLVTSYLVVRGGDPSPTNCSSKDGYPLGDVGSSALGLGGFEGLGSRGTCS